MSGKLWYAPHDDAEHPAIVTIDLGEGFTDISEPQLDEIADVAEALDGSRTRTRYRCRRKFTIIYEFAELATFVSLQNLCSHLVAGHPIGLALEADNAVAGHVLANILHSSTSFEYNPHWLLDVYGLTAKTLASTDIVVIRTPQPEYRELFARVSSSSTTAPASVTLNSAASHRFDAGASFRNEGFWPLCRLDPDAGGRQLLRTETHRRSWVLELPLVEDLAWEIEDLPSLTTRPPGLSTLIDIFEGV